jgi:hypothetical protein
MTTEIVEIDSRVKVATVEDLQVMFPTRKNAITEEVVDLINRSMNEPEFQGESLLQSAVTYENVMKNNKASIRDYLNAVRFCAYLISLEDNYTEAYKKTFYDRKFVMDRLHVSTQDAKYRELTSAASRYRRSKLVTDILALSQVPLDLIFTGYRYKAVGILANLMETSKLDRDKINAAKELLAATKSEVNKISLDVGVSSAAMSMQDQLNKQLFELAANQKKMLEAGLSIKDVQKVKVDVNNMGSEDYIEGEVNG